MVIKPASTASTPNPSSSLRAPAATNQQADSAAPLSGPATMNSGQQMNLVDGIDQVGSPVIDKLGRHAGQTDGSVDAQTRVANWFNKGPSDGVEGTRADKAYRVFDLPEGLSPSPVIVAVIDSGVDIQHEDLRGAPVIKNGKITYPNSRIWTNKGEIPGDGIDNDHDGYVDDVHGWNFLGGHDANGNPVDLGSTRLEVTREFLRLRKKSKTVGLTPHEQKYFQYLASKIPSGSSSPYYDLIHDRRKAIIGDDPYNFKDHNYGNNDVQGPNAFHGTHVAGIIAAIRNNSKGIMGVAANVKILPVRAVPDGDESDKDVANAIRFAADHGAQIINMSFAKYFSTGPKGKAAVDAAVRYAKKKGVKLFVHAAGNEDIDMDKPLPFGGHYPNDRLGDDRSKEIPGWLEVGASTPRGTAASFSNYGKKWVDLFAPGTNIVSTTPGNHYESASGTSMAAPVTSGVAAVVLSVFPELTSQQLMEVMTKGARPDPSLDGLARNPAIADVVSALDYAGKLLGKPLPRAQPAARVA